jgi:hypothetical protein
MQRVIRSFFTPVALAAAIGAFTLDAANAQVQKGQGQEVACG